ncbi:hypothetical protein KY290_017921 [Solanum tuberosum]|uniref:Urease accessory protein F n=1 Tax=Solanum tuberosum TaxID=4113 RepID=A0ABQ7VDH6_SOLTU|nr:hypothetical protein KY285_016882 [Solanum tuberosum]KAH0761848.1 hypothetical protein KY290_017921 [Solanum tuberosum]
MEDVEEKIEGSLQFTPNELLQWSQWQLLDSVLPTGGFAHSFGVEAAIQARLVSGPEDLRTFVIHILENTGSLLLPFVYTLNTSPNVETWYKLDKILDATLTNEVSRKTSISQGSALLRVAAAVFQEVPYFKTMREMTLASGAVRFHHAPIFGLVCGLLGLNAETSQKTYLFITMRDVVSAATRLNLVGPLGAAVLQHQLAANAEELSKKWMNRPVEEACQTNPLLDTIQGCHGFYHYICLQETTCTALHEARGITNMGEVQGCESCNQLVQQAYLSKYFSSLVRPTYLSATHFPGKD